MQAPAQGSTPKYSQFIQRGRPQESRLGMNVVGADEEDKEVVHGAEDVVERVCIHSNHNSVTTMNNAAPLLQPVFGSGIRPIPTSTACACTRASIFTISDACHDADIVNDTNHHKHIAAAAAGLQCRRQNMSTSSAAPATTATTAVMAAEAAAAVGLVHPPFRTRCRRFLMSATTATATWPFRGTTSVADLLDGITSILIIVLFTPSPLSTTTTEAATTEAAAASPWANTAAPPVSLSAYVALADRELGAEKIHMLSCRDDDARKHGRFKVADRRLFAAQLHHVPGHWVLSASYDGTVYVADSSTQSSTGEQTEVSGAPAAQAGQHKPPTPTWVSPLRNQHDTTLRKPSSSSMGNQLQRPALTSGDQKEGNIARARAIVVLSFLADTLCCRPHELADLVANLFSAATPKAFKAAATKLAQNIWLRLFQLPRLCMIHMAMFALVLALGVVVVQDFRGPPEANRWFTAFVRMQNIWQDPNMSLARKALHLVQTGAWLCASAVWAAVIVISPVLQDCVQHFVLFVRDALPQLVSALQQAIGDQRRPLALRV
ncbi:hypothetical protein PTSG_02608 [Salpingoeca rosetta]|uniref:Uncharacterized protein n=1 Tax=Salpingoeca rosetta (strain ATCC 50818 / BSB-021) TaxID=946362 RepID=F2U2S8_SALR5|nr:uncharacterized protein PTSG_02608 [Salpingoeca rosetta]EGD81922.1 hypothetical protein PTSG_02608 [Salpingoeca rosetta]|eukprot:XP_004996105.1 hypothetical protein PTSG_02608 [Salpingoeca rosetta]